MVTTNDYEGYVIFVYENGKIAKVPLKSYETKTNRKKLANAYSDKAKLVKVLFSGENSEIILRSTNNRALVFNTGMILPKSARDTIGVQVMALKSKAFVESAVIVTNEDAEAINKYRTKTIPATGSIAKDLPDENQLTLE
jgi:DNA gyrase subunit A